MRRLHHDPHSLDVAPVRPHADALVDGMLSAPLFAGIQREEIVAILGEFDEESFGQGHHMTLQGLRGSDFFVIADGRARVLVDGSQVATLGRGDCFGEVGVLSGSLRTATVEATTPMRCLVLPHRGLETLLMRHPQLGVNLLRQVLARNGSTSASESRAAG